jgi:hypothetical protein
VRLATYRDTNPALAALLDAYFHFSLAALPILDRSRFLVSLEEGKFSHLLLKNGSKRREGPDWSLVMGVQMHPGS